MKLKKRKFLGSFNRFRLMLTLGLAVVLPDVRYQRSVLELVRQISYAHG
jgi:hypothetical protein